MFHVFHYIRIYHFTQEKSSLSFLSRSISTINYSVRWWEQETRSPTQTTFIVYDSMNEGEKVFSFVLRSHPSANNLHSSSCQRHTPVIIPLITETQLQHIFVISSRMKTFLSPASLALFSTSKVFRWCRKSIRIWCVINLRACVWCVFVNKGNEFRLFHSHLAFIALNQDERSS